MNVVIGVRELRMSHVRAQIRKHGIQMYYGSNGLISQPSNGLLCGLR